jgi:hypothetical protein
LFEDQGSPNPQYGIVFNRRETFVGSGIYEWWSAEISGDRISVIHHTGTAERLIWFAETSTRFYSNYMLGASFYPWNHDGVRYTGVKVYLSIEENWYDGDGAERIHFGPVYVEDLYPTSIGNFGITAKGCHVMTDRFEIYESNTQEQPIY